MRVAAFLAICAFVSCSEDARKKRPPLHERKGVFADGAFEKTDELVFGRIAVGDDARGRDAAERVCAHLRAETGLVLKPVVASHYLALAEYLDKGHIDVAWLPPAVFAQVEDVEALTLLGAISRGGDTYRSIIFVKRTSPIREVADLAGKDIAWVDPFSMAGYIAPRGTLRDRGIDPDRDLGDQRFYGSHGNVVRAVAEDKAAAGATYLDRAEDGAGEPQTGWTKPGYAADLFRILAKSDPIRSDVLVVRKAVGQEKVAKIRDALLSMHEHPEGKKILTEVFSADRIAVADERAYRTFRDQQKAPR